MTKSAITKETKVGEIVARYGAPAVRVMVTYGLHCAGCLLNTHDTLESGGRLHGFSDEVIARLVDDLNRAISEPAVEVPIAL